MPILIIVFLNVAYLAIIIDIKRNQQKADEQEKYYYIEMLKLFETKNEKLNKELNYYKKIIEDNIVIYNNESYNDMLRTAYTSYEEDIRVLDNINTNGLDVRTVNEIIEAINELKEKSFGALSLLNELEGKDE